MSDKKAAPESLEENIVDENQEIESKDDGSHMLSNKIKASARQIWLAGLGAYNKAEEDTGKFFEKLVKEGEEIENKTRSTVKKQIQAVEDTVEDVKTKASGTLGKLESVFDERVSRALGRLGIPSKKDIDDLTQKVENLEKEIDALKAKTK